MAVVAKLGLAFFQKTTVKPATLFFRQCERQSRKKLRSAPPVCVSLLGFSAAVPVKVRRMTQQRCSRHPAQHGSNDRTAIVVCSFRRHCMQRAEFCFRIGVERKDQLAGRSAVFRIVAMRSLFCIRMRLTRAVLHISQPATESFCCGGVACAVLLNSWNSGL